MTTHARVLMSVLARSLRAAIAAALELVPEALTALAFLAGWLLVTHALVELLHRPILWSLSIGVLLLSLCGWRFVATMLSQGLYVLARKPRGER